MPNSNTFEIKPIAELIQKYLQPASVDPFANSNKLATLTNDIDKSFDCNFNIDALDFLKIVGEDKASTMLFDPPYSPRQVSEVYKKLGKTVNMQTTQSSYWSNLKKEIARIVKPGGHCITCAWNSGGIGKTLGFEQVEILLVAHGGWHNDTIVTVERKI